MLVAEGAVDGAVDAIGVSEWDLAAVQVIVEEAGGRFSDFAGDARIDGGSARSPRTASCTTSCSLLSRSSYARTARFASMPASSDANESENFCTPSDSSVAVTSS